MAASFDCSRAASRTETEICSNDKLSRLDEALAVAYRSTLQATAQPEAARIKQRQWLHDVRDACRDETCLARVYELRIAELSPPANAEWRSFRDPALNIAFEYRSDWTVSVGCHGSRACVSLSDKAGLPESYLLAFETFPGDLEQTAVDRAVFRRTVEGWTAKGRSGDHRVERVKGSGWHGLRAVVDCGISDSQGFHAAAGQCLWVVMSNGRRSVVADTQGIGPITGDIARTIQSVRIIGD